MSRGERPEARPRWAWRAVPLGLLALVVAFKWETFSLPGFWDEMFVFIQSSQWLAGNEFFRILPGLRPNTVCYGHPPFIFLSLSVLYRIFGFVPAVPHVFAALFAFLGLYGTYRLGSHLHDRRAGLIAALTLFFSPLYYAQSGLASAEIFVAALTVWCVYFLLTENTAGYLVAGMCLAMTKGTALAVFVAILAYLVLFERRRAGFGRRFWLSAAPLAALVLFLAAQRLITGHAVDNPALQKTLLAEGFRFDWAVAQLGHIGRLIFVHQWRFVATAVAAVFALVHYRRLLKPAYALFLFIFCGFSFSFSLVYFLPRYILAIFPFLFILFAVALLGLERNRAATRVIVLVLCLLGLAASYQTPTNGDYGLESTMSYADYVRANLEAARYVEAAYGDRTVDACEGGMELTEPGLGFVTRKLNRVRGDAEVVITPVLAYPESYGCKDGLIGEGYAFDNVFRHGAVSFEVYVKPGLHRFR